MDRSGADVGPVDLIILNRAVATEKSITDAGVVTVQHGSGDEILVLLRNYLGAGWSLASRSGDEYVLSKAVHPAYRKVEKGPLF